MIVLLLVVAVTGSLGLLFYYLEATVQVSRDLRNQLQDFYTCDGLDRIVVHLVEDYVAQAPAPGAEGLETWICSQGGGCGTRALPDLVPDGFQLEVFSVETIDDGRVGPLPTGPFRGMESDQSRVQVVIEVVIDQADVPYRCRITRDVAFARVVGTQFFLRGEGYTDWFPTRDTDIEARAHVDGDLCFASSASLRLSRLTASGGLLHPSHEDCLTDRPPLSGTAEVATTPDFDTFSTWSEGTDHGCTACGGTVDDWEVYAQVTWRGRALDGAHRVPPLQLDVEAPPPVQHGADALGATVDNADTVRMALEPVADATAADVLAASLARQAHVRILNGTWYLQDPDDPDAWPGVPIWSDHPGRLTSAAEVGVVVGGLGIGQEDLRTARGWGSQPPRRFSYYRVNPSNGLMHNPTPAREHVVSYGSLARTGAGKWMPGRWVTAGSTTPGVAGTATVTGLVAARSGVGCSTEPGPPARYLDATRGGFHDPQVEMAASASRAEVLPLNFDVSAFLEALDDDHTGELGSYFCDLGEGCLMNQPFNGIVWISATWPGSMDGQGTGHAQAPPPQGAQGPLPTAPQPMAPDHPAAQHALPMPLCSTDSDYVGERLTPDGFFVVPACGDYGYGDATAVGAARLTAVRLFHAEDLLDEEDGAAILDRDGDGQADGLTLASNLPVYLLGPANSGSDPSIADAATWTPLFVAADQLTVLSAAWDDGASPWGSLAAETLGDRTASDTLYHLSVLAGWSPSAEEEEASAWGGGVEGLLRTVEDWDEASAVFRGSLDIGFAAVHHRWPPSEEEDAGTPPVWDMAYDPHLADFDNAPPGAVRYVVHGPLRWEGR